MRERTRQRIISHALKRGLFKSRRRRFGRWPMVGFKDGVTRVMWVFLTDKRLRDYRWRAENAWYFRGDRKEERAA